MRCRKSSNARADQLEGIAEAEEDVDKKGGANLGQKREALDISAPNVDLNWRMTTEMITAAKTYAQHMLELKQIKQLPDFDIFFNTKFSDELAKST